MQKNKIGILRGGFDNYYEISLEKGGDLILSILQNLSETCEIIDIFIDSKYNWHVNGIPIRPYSLIGKVDVIWNFSGLNLNYILRDFKIPIFCGVHNFSIYNLDSKHYDIFKKHMEKIGIMIPKYLTIPIYQRWFGISEKEYILRSARLIFNKLNLPLTIKSFYPGNFINEIGMYVVSNFQELHNSINRDILNNNIVIEERPLGESIYIHTVRNFRNKSIYVFPIIKFSTGIKERLNIVAKKLHLYFDSLEHFKLPYLKSNFILKKKNINKSMTIDNLQIYLTKIEFTPNLKQDSHFYKSCESIGSKIHHVLGNIIERYI